MERRFGIAPASAREQLQKVEPDPTAEGYYGSPLQPLPAGTPGRATGEQVGIKDPGATVSFVVLGDSGGVKDPNPQNAVAAGIAAVLPNLSPPPAFVYHVGDLIYFNGDPDQWAPQFYEPYAHALSGLPIVGILGNHDGDASDGITGSGAASFMANLCAASPGPPPGDPSMEYGRTTQTQPYCDWTLTLDGVTIVGVWSNVPSGGHLYPQQTDWLTGELKAAPTDRPLIVSLHHPPYSVDAHHGGSARMGAALDACFAAAERWPSLVLSGHVHDYQRFTRKAGSGSLSYIVQGAGGYHNRHPLATDASPGLDVLGDGSVIFESGFASAWSFSVLTVSAAGIAGKTYAVDGSGSPPSLADSFSLPA